MKYMQKNTRNKVRLVSLSAVATILGACIGGGGEPTTFHTLRAQPVSNTVMPAQNQPIIALRNLTLPGYLDEKQIVYLEGSSKIAYLEGQQWAEPLSSNLRNVFIEQLRNLTGNPRILAFPLANNVRPDRIIDLQISEFAAQKDARQLQVNANWQVSKTGKEQDTAPPGYKFNRSYPLQDGSVESLMRNYQQAVNDLSIAVSDTL